MRSECLLQSVLLPLLLADPSFGFIPSSSSSCWGIQQATTTTTLFAGKDGGGFIETELRAAAMRLHTTQQAPKEGKVIVEEPPERRVPTHADYLQYLVDNRHVYEALEEIVENENGLKTFQNTGLERVVSLEKDIEFMAKEYELEIPSVGQAGADYAKYISSLGSVPRFMCHYYNFYFAHTAGGRMIGKQMSKLLLDNKVLEFYKWEGNLQQIKATVKENIENMVETWDEDERASCVEETRAAFGGGGSINRYLS